MRSLVISLALELGIRPDLRRAGAVPDGKRRAVASGAAHAISTGNDPAEFSAQLLAIVVVVPVGHLTHFMHIFQESHVPSQQT